MRTLLNIGDIGKKILKWTATGCGVYVSFCTKFKWVRMGPECAFSFIRKSLADWSILYVTRELACSLAKESAIPFNVAMLPVSTFSDDSDGEEYYDN